MTTTPATDRADVALERACACCMPTVAKAKDRAMARRDALDPIHAFIG